MLTLLLLAYLVMDPREAAAATLTTAPLRGDASSHKGGCRDRCEKLCRMIEESGISPLLSSAPGDFFSRGHWEGTVPAAWREELLAMTDETLHQVGGPASHP